MFSTKKISDRLKEIEKKQEYLQEEIEEKRKFVEHDFITSEKVRKALKMDIFSLNLKSQKELKKLIQKWIIKIELTTTEAIAYFDLRRL